MNYESDANLFYDPIVLALVVGPVPDDEHDMVLLERNLVETTLLSEHTWRGIAHRSLKSTQCDDTKRTYVSWLIMAFPFVVGAGRRSTCEAR